MSDQVKLSFIHKCVQSYVNEVVTAMDRSIRKNNVVATGALRNSLSNAVNENVGKLIFLEYGRFVDMGVGRGKSLADIGKDKSKKLRKKKRIYSPIAYGKLNGLISDLMFGLTEETIATIKNELNQTPNGI